MLAFASSNFKVIMDFISTKKISSESDLIIDNPNAGKNSKCFSSEIFYEYLLDFSKHCSTELKIIIIDKQVSTTYQSMIFLRILNS